MNASAAPTPYLSLSAILRALRGEVGGWHLRGMLSHVLMLLMYRRLGEIATKIERLMVRFHAGRLLRRVAVARGRRVGKTGTRIWPGRFGWLVRVASYQAAGYGCQLRHSLEQPEMVELLTASPHAARLLKPVCRMLAIETSVLRPGQPEPEPKVRKPRLRTPRPKPEPFRIPLPRGVLTAVRQRRFCLT
ncbi:MAG: hypothetical protein P4L66_08650 [Acetobacteraceae bacterium]|nr:hypothetical protein [Acetobacteraceae bacterium]